jgi:uncharacterized protein DUF3716
MYCPNPDKPSKMVDLRTRDSRPSYYTEVAENSEDDEDDEEYERFVNSAVSARNTAEKPINSKKRPLSQASPDRTLSSGFPAKRSRVDIDKFSEKCEKTIQRKANYSTNKHLQNVLKKFPTIQRNVIITRERKWKTEALDESAFLNQLDNGGRRSTRLSAVALQMRGNVAIRQCQICRNGEGYFDECVVGDDDNEACASCQYYDRYYHDSSREEMINRCLGRIPIRSGPKQQRNQQSKYHIYLYPGGRRGFSDKILQEYRTINTHFRTIVLLTLGST